MDRRRCVADAPNSLPSLGSDFPLFFKSRKAYNTFLSIIIPGEVDMQALKDRILREGKKLGGGILKVDNFINHQVDPELREACGIERARRFAPVNATRVLTAEISGIAPALMT